MVNANAAVTAVVPVPETETTNTGSGTTGASCLGFKAKNGSRSSPKTGSRLQNASKPGTAGTVVADRMVTAKQNQNKEQAEKKNQAINQLRRMLVQGNKRVEALATVIQHLFTEVLTYFCLQSIKQILHFHCIKITNVLHIVILASILNNTEKGHTVWLCDKPLLMLVIMFWHLGKLEEVL